MEKTKSRIEKRIGKKFTVFICNDDLKESISGAMVVISEDSDKTDEGVYYFCSGEQMSARRCRLILNRRHGVELA